MSRVVSFMRDLVAKGMSWEDAAMFAERFEGDLKQAVEEAVALARPARSSAAERQARYRERNARDVTDLPPSPETKISPEPPIKTQTSSPIQTPPIVPLSPSKSRGSKRCPEQWTPSSADLGIAAAEGFTPGEIDRELAKIRDCEFAKAHSDWSAVFRNWIRRAAEQKPRLVTQNGQPPGSAKLAAKQANLESAQRGFEIAAARRPF